MTSALGCEADQIKKLNIRPLVTRSGSWWRYRLPAPEAIVSIDPGRVTLQHLHLNIQTGPTTYCLQSLKYVIGTKFLEKDYSSNLNAIAAKNPDNVASPVTLLPPR